MQDAEVIETQESWREYQILHQIEQDENISQRNLSQGVGIALGLTNQIMKRLIRSPIASHTPLEAGYSVSSRSSSKVRKRATGYCPASGFQ